MRSWSRGTKLQLDRRVSYRVLLHSGVTTVTNNGLCISLSTEEDIMNVLTTKKINIWGDRYSDPSDLIIIKYLYVPKQHIISIKCLMFVYILKFLKWFKI
jgi:hypothetical protein